MASVAQSAVSPAKVSKDKEKSAGKEPAVAATPKKPIKGILKKPSKKKGKVSLQARLKRKKSFCCISMHSYSSCSSNSSSSW